MKLTLFLLLAAALASAADPPHVSVALSPAASRRSAPRFELKDASGRTIRLEKYKGKVVLLDFWATWCTGCKQEIPWFIEFQKKYKGLAVVGVSMDQDGWKALNPYLAAHPIPYRIVLGGDSIAKNYGIEAMPDTFLIDRQGRIAASYTTGLVDRDNVEQNLKAMLAERR